MFKKFITVFFALALYFSSTNAALINTLQFNAVDTLNISLVRTESNFTIDRNVPEDTMAIFPAPIISNNMVLQRNAVNHLWGKASLNGPIAVEINGKQFYGEVKNHAFDIYTGPMREGIDYTMTFYTPSAKLTLRNVAIGEVFLLSGQSNITYRLQDIMHDQGNCAGVYKPTLKVDPETFYHFGIGADNYGGWNDTLRKKNESMLEDNHLIRMCYIACPMPKITVPNETLDCKWYEATKGIKDDSRNVSALAYYFAREMQHATGLPIGVVPSSLGGTLVVPWVPLDAYAKNKDAFYYLGDDETYYNKPSRCYNYYIAPITKYKYKAVLWWQGDGQPLKWVEGMTVLVNSWREAMGNKNEPFYLLENDRSGEIDTIPAGYADKVITTANADDDFGTLDGWPQCRANVQKMCAITDSCYFVVNLDTGAYDEYHSSWDKNRVAERCCKTFLKYAYGLNILMSPQVTSCRVSKKGVELKLNNVGKGIIVKNNGRNFDIKVGENWLPARAYKVNRNTILVKTRDAKVSANDYQGIRYGYRNFPRINRRYVWQYMSVYNENDMPLDQFERTLKK
jgi:hypothetical protein